MKAILEFDLNDVHERSSHKRAISSTNAYLVLSYLDSFLRDKLKYENLSDEVAYSFQETRDTLGQLMENLDINLNDLE